jgi:hypothetical protein
MTVLISTGLENFVLYRYFDLRSVVRGVKVQESLSAVSFSVFRRLKVAMKASLIYTDNHIITGVMETYAGAEEYCPSKLIKR